MVSTVISSWHWTLAPGDFLHGAQNIVRAGNVTSEEQQHNIIYKHNPGKNWDQIYPDNIIIGYPSTHQVGGKDTEQPGVLQIFGIKNCFISFLFVSVSMCPLLCLWLWSCYYKLRLTWKRHKLELTLENVKESQFKYLLCHLTMSARSDKAAAAHHPLQL